jgi:excisionase family DNA binding protein
MSADSPLLLKSSEASSRLGVSKATLHRWVRAGKIECIHIERNAIYFTQEALNAFIERHRKVYRPHYPA